MPVEFQNHRVDRKNRAGSTAIVRVKDDKKLPGRYTFDTHGMTDEEIEAKVAALESYHRDKRVKLRELEQDAEGIEITVDGSVYRIVDATVEEQGTTDVRLYVDVRQLVGERLVKVRGFPLQQWYPKIEQMPPAADVVTMVRDRLQSIGGISISHVERMEKLKTKLNKAREGG